MTASSGRTVVRLAFPLRMAWRESRDAWRTLAFFFLCVALGVAAIVALRSLVQNVRTTLTAEARTLIGADLVVQTTRPWTPDQTATIDRILATSPARTDVVQTQTMAAAPRPNGVVRLVELWGVGPGFPYYGGIQLDDGRAFSADLLTDRGAAITTTMATQFGVAVGDDIRLAGRPFTVRAIVARDRLQGAGGLSFGPRVYVTARDLEGLGVLGPASRATYQVLVRVDATQVATLTSDLQRALEHDSVSVRSWQGVQDRLGRNLTLAENYLSLVGLAVVVLGGIGVWSVTRVFVQRKIRTVAILKCLGATSPVVLTTYVLQVAALSSAGSVLGVIAAAVAIASIPARLLVPVGLTSAHVTWSGAAQGVAVGLLVSLLFAVVPLVEIRRVKPLLLLRADATPLRPRRDWVSLTSGAGLAGALALVAVWQAGAVRAGLFVWAGLGIVGLVLALAAALLVRVVGPLARSSGFSVRHAMISLGRPGNQTRVMLMAVGIGGFFVLGIRAVERNLVHAFAAEIGTNAPDLVLIDVQRDEVDGVAALAAPYAREPVRMVPLLRGRVTSVIGRRVNLPTREAVQAQGELTREYGLTYRTALDANEQVTAGTFWTGPLPASGTPDGLDTEVSIEETLAHEDADVDVGDIMTFDIGGQPIRARVTSIRHVTWDQSQNGGFVFVLRPAAAVERAPHAFVAFLDLVADPAAAGTLERALVRRYPNVSAIDLREVLASLREVLDDATLGVTIVGAVLLAGGGLILVGAVAMTRFQRVYDAAIYRTLGAGTRRLLAMVAIEYGILGAMAGVIAAGGALGLSWAAARHLFDIDWEPQPGLLAVGVGGLALMVGLVGLAASADVLVRKPLETLRGE